MKSVSPSHLGTNRELAREPPSAAPAPERDSRSTSARSTGLELATRMTVTRRDPSMNFGREVEEGKRLLAAAYYPLGHERLHLHTRALDLDAIGPVGRLDETGRLRTVILAMPDALAGEWRFSPLAAQGEVRVDTNRAMQQHATLTRFLLEQGVTVHLVASHGRGASEAVYATDCVTGLGAGIAVGRPLHHARFLETLAYTGGVRMGTHGGKPGPVEFGDVLLAYRDGKVHVFQGYNSWRGTTASLETMQRALHELRRRHGGPPFVHVPVELSGNETLHLDFVLNHAGPLHRRVVLACPSGLKDQGVLERYARVVGAHDRDLVTVSHEEMLAAAVNIESVHEALVLQAANPLTARTAAELEARGIVVWRGDFSEMTQKDGSFHCVTGQVYREAPR